eukprot:366327-Chlamydomonas_euryale.AAC.7
MGTVGGWSLYRSAMEMMLSGETHSFQLPQEAGYHVAAPNLSLSHTHTHTPPPPLCSLQDVLQNTVGGGKPKMKWHFGNNGWPASKAGPPPQDSAARDKLVDDLQVWPWIWAPGGRGHKCRGSRAHAILLVCVPLNVGSFSWRAAFAECASTTCASSSPVLRRRLRPHTRNSAKLTAHELTAQELTAHELTAQELTAQELRLPPRMRPLAAFTRGAPRGAQL